MGNRNSPAVGTPVHRWQGWCLIVLGGLAWLSIGCSPQSISMFLMPFTDNKVDPEYKLFSASKEITLVILAGFAQTELREDLRPAEVELPEQLREAFRKRCQDNKHKIKIISLAEVRNFQQKEEMGSGELTALEAGKHFKADYVLDLSIQSLQLYEPMSYPKLFHGRSEIEVCLYKMGVKDGEPKVFNKSVSTVYPGERGPTDAGNTPAAVLRGILMTKVSRDISKIFIAYDPEEKKMLE